MYELTLVPLIIGSGLMLLYGYTNYTPLDVNVEYVQFNLPSGDTYRAWVPTGLFSSDRTPVGHHILEDRVTRLSHIQKDKFEQLTNSTTMSIASDLFLQKLENDTRNEVIAEIANEMAKKN